MTLSIAMTTFNGAAFVAEQLDSIVRQSRSPDELVVCDDASADATVEILRGFASAAPFRVHIHVNQDRVGVRANSDSSITRCSGDLVVLCDQDDCWMPSKLARIERAFDRPEVGLVFSDADIVDAHGRLTGDRLWQRLELDASVRRVLEGPTASTAIDALLPGSLVTGAAVAFRASLRDVVTPTPAGLQLSHDGWLAMVVAALAEMRSIDEPLMRYRQHAQQQVGPRPRRVPARGLRVGLTRVTNFHEQIAVADCLRGRLTSQSTHRPRPGVIAGLDNRLRHLRARAGLAGSMLGRLGPVTAELMSGRYHRYSRGVLSAVKDVARRFRCS